MPTRIHIIILRVRNWTIVFFSEDLIFEGFNHSKNRVFFFKFKLPSVFVVAANNQIVIFTIWLVMFRFYFAASVHQQSPIIDRVAAATPPTLSNLSSDSAYDKFRLLNGHHVSLLSQWLLLFNFFNAKNERDYGFHFVFFFFFIFLLI